MNRNYQNELDELLKSLGTQRPRLLLHACCAPCASYVLSNLIEHFDITLLYYNPNIRPLEEYERRLFWLQRLLEGMDLTKSVPLVVPDYETERFSSAAVGLEMEPEGAGRCAVCFRLRLDRTAAMAARGGFDFFCTTLTVSPHKDAKLINELGLELSACSGVRWLTSDFKKRDGYRQSIALSAKYGLYRQNTCGCGLGGA